jgi:hypothetical protein
MFVALISLPLKIAVVKYIAVFSGIEEPGISVSKFEDVPLRRNQQTPPNRF